MPLRHVECEPAKNDSDLWNATCYQLRIVARGAPADRSMKKSTKNLYGNVPDTSPVALLLIDVINDLDFPEGPALLPSVAAWR
jgi:hypothetical protein